MRLAPARRGLASAAAVCLAIVGDAQAQQRPPGLAPDPTSAEAGLWSSSERAERGARASAELNTDPALTDYVRQVACGVAPEYCSEIRVYVMDRPAFNATAAPNGYIEVWSGLLLRADNEAELAFVLGHEIGHYAENHSIERWNTTKGWTTAAMVVTLGAGVAGAYYQVNLSGVGDLAYLTALSSIFSYSRGQENQSDSIGFERVAAAGYDPAAPARLWRSLQAETRASSFASVRRAEAAGSAFRTHPVTQERVEALDRLAAGQPATGRLERARYRAAIRPHLGLWLKQELEKRDFNGLLVLVERLEQDGDDLGVIQFYKGEIYRRRRDEGDLERARVAYGAASAHADAPVEVWRELGDIQARLQDTQGARASYLQYLEQASTADDRWLVEDHLNSLDGG